jgi:hypothetical protein
VRVRVGGQRLLKLSLLAGAGKIFDQFCGRGEKRFETSLVTPPPVPEQVGGLTWEHPMAVITQARFLGITDPRVLAGLLVATLMILYYLFR